MKRSYRFTLADDDHNILFLTQSIVCQVYPNSAIASFTTAEDARHHVLNRSADLVIVDHGMAGMNGTELIRELRKQGFSNPIIMLSGNVEIEQESRQAGANEFLLKSKAAPLLAGMLKKFLPP